MKIMVGLLVIVGLMVLFTVEGATIIVDDNDEYLKWSDFNQIQPAIDDLSTADEDIIYVYAGEYADDEIVVDLELTIIGNGSDVTTITLDHAGDVLVTLTANHVNISGFTFKPPVNDSINGIKIDSKYNTIDNCVFNDTLFAIYDDTDGQKNIISNNSCSNGSRGIYIKYSSNTIIENNTCRDNTGQGIWIDNNVDQITLYNNSCTNNFRGIEIELYCEYINITHNNCSGNDYDGIKVDSTVNIINNTCNNNTISGIYLTGSYCQIISNDCCGNDKGIKIQSGSHDSNIEWNLLNDNEYGIYMKYGYSNDIINNSFTSNAKAVSLLTRADDNYIFENYFSVNIYGVFIDVSHYNNISTNEFDYDNNFSIYLKKSNNNDIYRNQIEYSFNGIYIEGTSAVTPTYGNYVSENHCTNNWNYGLYIKWGSRNNNQQGTENVVCYNTFHYNEYGLYLYQSDHLTIERNYYNHNDKDGIYAYESHNNDFRWIDCSNNSRHGQFMVNSDDNLIWCCSFSENSNYGVKLDGCTGNQIDHNNFWNNGPGLPTRQAYDNTLANNWDQGAISSGNWWNDCPVPNGRYFLDGGVGAADNHTRGVPV